MSSDRYACAGCEKYFHELDMVKDPSRELICKECEADYAAGRTPRKAIKIAAPYLCNHCSYRSSWSFSVCGKCGAHGSCLNAKEDKKVTPDDSHYHKGKMDPWKFIEANDLNFFEGSVVKYVARWRHKNGVEDLKKARVYIDELIRQAEIHS